MTARRLYPILLIAGMAFHNSAWADRFISLGFVHQTITRLPARDFGPLRVIELTINDPTSPIQQGQRDPVRFFGLTTFPQGGTKFWHSIPVYKGDDLVEVAVVDAPDCAYEEVAIRGYRNGIVDLLVSYRAQKFAPESPESMPAARKVDVFRLTQNVNQELGFPPVYFKWIRRQFFKRPVCTDQEIDQELRHVPP